MPVREVERLKDKLKDAEVWIEVGYYPVLEREYNGSGARGRVKSISMENEIIYTNE